MSKAIKALEYASAKHNGMYRFGKKGKKLPYIIHPVRVMMLVEEYFRPIVISSQELDDYKCVALLHDTIEDTDATYDEIKSLFGRRVANFVLALTNDEEKANGPDRDTYMTEKIIAMGQTTFRLKLIDRLANISENPSVSYCKRTIKIMGDVENKRTIHSFEKELINIIIDKCNKRLGA